MKHTLLTNKIQCSYCEALLTPAQFAKHWHEDYTYND